MKIALAMIVKGTDDEAVLLDRCLDNMLSQDAIDGIYITNTHLPGKKPNRAVAEIAKKHGAIVSDYEWNDNFADARNFNFSQVPKDFDFILWTDADDAWRGLEKLKPTIEADLNMDAFAFNYLYEWDEHKLPTVVHRKTMLVKNDNCVTWVGALHEDLMETRSLSVQTVEGIERCHLTTNERAADNAKRNVRIAEKEALKNPNDPRSYWNLANSQYGIGDYEGSQKSFEQFIKESNSDDEKYIAHQRLSDVYRNLNDRAKSVEQLMLAVGMEPMLPDAYLQAAHLYYTYGNLDKAEEYSIMGMVRRPQPDRMIVFNPRDYDYNPMMLLARVYYEKNRPDKMLPLLKGCLRIYPDDERLKKIVEEGTAERDQMAAALEEVKKLQDIKDDAKLKAAIEALPVSIRSHPAVAVIRNERFIKTESSGKDLVIYCGVTAHEWNPVLFKTKGVGGSEEAVIHLARKFRDLGWNVTVYNTCGSQAVPDGLGVLYRPSWEFNYRDKQDAMILWRWVKPLDAPINCPKIFVDLHDVVPAGEFNEKRLEKVSRIFVKTKFHRSLFPNVPDDKIAVIPNGFESYLDPKIKKEPKLVINTSSPDRSMDVLPELWKRVKAKVPDARMIWAYGWDIYKTSNYDDPKKMKWMEETIAAMDDAGIEQVGKLPQHEVAKLYQRAFALAYPTEFAEIDCISVKKAQAARCIPVATDFGALDESIEYGVRVHSKKTGNNWNKPYQFHFGLEDEKAQDEWVSYMVDILEGGMEVEWDGIDEWSKQYSWASIARRWDDILNA